MLCLARVCITLLLRGVNTVIETKLLGDNTQRPL